MLGDGLIFHFLDMIERIILFAACLISLSYIFSVFVIKAILKPYSSIYTGIHCSCQVPMFRLIFKFYASGINV